MSDSRSRPGRLRKAPEHFLSLDGQRIVQREARAGRRDFIQRAFAAAAAGAAAPLALAQASPSAADGGDPA